MIQVDAFWIVLFTVLGLTFGSFGTVIIARVPAGKHVGGRSRCARCGHVLGAVEIIPLLSYLTLRGKCRHCGHAISAWYPLVEIASALLFVLALHSAPSFPAAMLLAFSLWVLLLIAVIDARTRTIHDALNLAFMAFAIAYALMIGQLHYAGALLFVLFFGAQWLVSRGRWVGSGDILLGAGIGFLLGDIGTALLCIGITYILGALAAIVLLLTKKVTRKSHIPLGPFLALSTFLVLLFLDWMASFAIRGTL